MAFNSSFLPSKNKVECNTIFFSLELEGNIFHFWIMTYSQGGKMEGIYAHLLYFIFTLMFITPQTQSIYIIIYMCVDQYIFESLL